MTETFFVYLQIHHGELAGKNGSGNQKIDGDKQAQISVDKGLMGIVPESTGPQVDNISSGSYFEVVTACGNSSINPSDHLVSELFFTNDSPKLHPNFICFSLLD